METAIDFIKPAFILITGASKGIGRQIAIDISKKLADNSKIVLLARSDVALKETEGTIISIKPNIKIIRESVDFQSFTLAQCEKLFDKFLEDTQYESAMIFHNVGSLGTLKKVTDLSDIEAWRKHFDLNLFSTMILNNEFIKRLKPLSKRIYAVNITSLCGRKPFEDLAMYGSAKAARDLCFKVLSLEEPDLIVLNYSPGPVKTDMVNEIVEKADNTALKTQFKTIIENKSILTPPQTVGKLMGLLESGKFKSGDVIDYYDL